MAKIVHGFGNIYFAQSWGWFECSFTPCIAKTHTVNLLHCHWMLAFRASGQSKVDVIPRILGGFYCLGKVVLCKINILGVRPMPEKNQDCSLLSCCNEKNIDSICQREWHCFFNWNQNVPHQNREIGKVWKYFPVSFWALLPSSSAQCNSYIFSWQRSTSKVSAQRWQKLPTTLHPFFKYSLPFPLLHFEALGRRVFFILAMSSFLSLATVVQP